MLLILLLALLPISIAQLAGAKEVDKSILRNPKFILAGMQAAQTVTNVQNGPKFWVFEKITRARLQPVAGALFYFEGIFGESQCNRNDPLGVKMFKYHYCRVSKRARRALFSFQYFEQSWKNKREIHIAQKMRDVDANEHF